MSFNPYFFILYFININIMIVSKILKDGTKFSYENGVFMISKSSAEMPDEWITLNDFETMNLLRFITDHLVKI